MLKLIIFITLFANFYCNELISIRNNTFINSDFKDVLLIDPNSDIYVVGIEKR